MKLDIVSNEIGYNVNKTDRENIGNLEKYFPICQTETTTSTGMPNNQYRMNDANMITGWEPLIGSSIIIGALVLIVAGKYITKKMSQNIKKYLN